MKKTIIALFALAGAASATSLEDFTLITGGNNSITTSSGSFTIAMTLDVETLQGVLEAGKNKSWGTDIVCYEIIGYNAQGEQTKTKTGVVINGGSNASSKITSSGLHARWGTDTAWNPDGGSDVRWDGGSDLADLNGSSVEGTGWGGVAYAGLVYSFGATSGTTVAFTLLDAQGNAIVESCVTAGGLKTSNAGVAAGREDDPSEIISFHSSVATSYYMQGYKNNASDLKALAGSVAMAAPIPEPTTATLSLLALAGLAARRRRK